MCMRLSTRQRMTVFDTRVSACVCARAGVFSCVCVCKIVFGGPARAGKVVGINTAIIAGAQGLSFSVPINTAKWVLQEILMVPSHDARVRAWCLRGDVRACAPAAASPENALGPAFSSSSHTPRLLAWAVSPLQHARVQRAGHPPKNPEHRPQATLNPQPSTLYHLTP